ncbi:hypothetical protein RIF29_29519 [Crotalaria pallida]|uniref:ELM2 domain-containing protein n=1 Tax=Crotalaria pallida TaxID=3830 RepID=A0AAN9EGV4_CROPI
MDDSICTFEPICKEKYCNQVAKKHTRGESASFSCLPVSKEKYGSLQGMQTHVSTLVTNEKNEYCSGTCCQDFSNRREPNDSIQETQGHVSSSTNDKEYCHFCCEDYSHLSDSDESIKGPSLVDQGILKCCYFETSNKSGGYSIKTTRKENAEANLFKELKLLGNEEDFDDSIENSCSLNSAEEDNRYLSSMGNHIPRRAIPVGPRFQAEVPQWEGTSNLRQYITTIDSKWFCNEIWPMPDDKETNKIGAMNDGPEACHCEFPRSVDCVHLHIREARELLQSEIGMAFASWKFDEMGEDVSKSWTTKEQQEFESLSRLNSLSNDLDFWEVATKNFPSKPLKSLINYYYNVFIPRKLRLETRACFGVIDNDDDKHIGYKKEDDRSTKRMQIVPIRKKCKSTIANYHQLHLRSKKH